MTQTDKALALNHGAKPVIAYCLFDFANSAFTTIIITFVFATYFANGVAADPVTGGAQWSLAMAVAGLAIALLSPFAGAIADQTGKRKSWLAGLSVMCVITSALLWYVRPTPADVPLALALVVISTIGFEVGMLFYNAMMPGVVPAEKLGRLSGWAWGVGYIGGLLSLVVALFGLVQADPAPFGLDHTAAEHVRATSPLVAIWFAVFAVPLFLFIKEPKTAHVPIGKAMRDGLQQVVTSLAHARRYKNMFKFLIAAMIYTDAVHTVFGLGGVYAGVTFGMDTSEVIQLGIALNVTAGLGAFFFGWLDDKAGSKITIAISLVALIVTSTATILATTKLVFWISALVMATFFGPVQAASRTMMARLAPEEMRGEMFGLFALSGKVTAFAGPALVGWLTLATGSYRLGMATVPLFLAVGLVLLRGVKEPSA